MAELPLPFRGAADQVPFIKQPGDTAPPGTIVNMRVRDTATGRKRLSTRPGLKLVSATRLGTGPVQALSPLTLDTAITGWESGAGTKGDSGTGHRGDAYQGQLWWLHNNWSMFIDFYQDMSPAGSGVEAVNSCGGDGAGNYCATINYTELGLKKVAILHLDNDPVYPLVSVATAEQTHDVTANTTVLSKKGFSYTTINQWVVVARAHQAPLQWFDCSGWANEAIECRLSPDETHLFIAFDGSRRTGTLPNLGGGTTIESGDPAQHFRAGVMKCAIDPGTGLLTQVPWGPQLDSTDELWEQMPGDYHGYVRLSEHSRTSPHGTKINAMAVCQDGGVVVARCNRGYGYDHTIVPNAIEPISVCKIGADGVIEWEIDTDSALDLMGGYYNDLDDPTFIAIRCGSDGSVYVGGREAFTDGPTCYRIRGADGAWGGGSLWSARLVDAGRSIRQAAIDIDPTSDNPVFGGDRSNEWDGSTYANLWEIDRQTGVVRRVYEEYNGSKYVSTLGLTIDDNGDLMQVTDYLAP